MTRDSRLWWAGIIAAVVVGLATLDGSGNGPTSLMYYGIPVAAAPYLRLAALIIGIVSGKMASSPLPHSDDANQIGGR